MNMYEKLVALAAYLNDNGLIFLKQGGDQINYIFLDNYTRDYLHLAEDVWTVESHEG